MLVASRLDTQIRMLQESSRPKPTSFLSLQSTGFFHCHSSGRGSATRHAPPESVPSHMQVAKVSWEGCHSMLTLFLWTTFDSFRICHCLGPSIASTHFSIGTCQSPAEHMDYWLQYISCISDCHCIYDWPFSLKLWTRFDKWPLNLAPAWRRRSTTSACPCSLASCKEVLP